LQDGRSGRLPVASQHGQPPLRLLLAAAAVGLGIALQLLGRRAVGGHDHADRPSFEQMESHHTAAADHLIVGVWGEHEQPLPAQERGLKRDRLLLGHRWGDYRGVATAPNLVDHGVGFL